MTVYIRPIRWRELGKLNTLFKAALETDFNYFPPAYTQKVKQENSLFRLVPAKIKKDRVFLAAFKDGRLSGYALGSAHADGVGQLYWLYVTPELRGQKVGKRLLLETINSMKDLGMDALELVTHDYEGYYKKQGFWTRGTKMIESVELKIMQYDIAKND